MAVLPNMLKSIPKETAIVIVDNASDDTAELKSLAKDSNITLILNKKNKGFGEACNQGAAIAKTEFIFFLNPDTKIEKNTLIELERAAKDNPNALAMNPKIVKSNGKPYFKRSSHLINRASWMGRGWPTANCWVNILSGAAFFIKAQAFYAVEGFDENIFLYHEEDDLCLRLKELGGELLFVHDATVQHIRGASSPPSKAGSYFKGWHMGKSRVYATRKHNRPFPVSAALAESILQILSPISILSSRKRSKNWGYLKGVISEWNVQ
jgi:GT2 family glycosyltransferase